MSYLTGKRCVWNHEMVDGLDKDKPGKIVSEPFLFSNQKPYTVSFGAIDDSCTARVAVLWDDGSMSGAVDVEELKILDMSEDFSETINKQKDKI